MTLTSSFPSKQQSFGEIDLEREGRETRIWEKEGGTALLQARAHGIQNLVQRNFCGTTCFPTVRYKFVGIPAIMVPAWQTVSSFSLEMHQIPRELVDSLRF